MTDPTPSTPVVPIERYGEFTFIRCNHGRDNGLVPLHNLVGANSCHVPMRPPLEGVRGDDGRDEQWNVYLVAMDGTEKFYNSYPDAMEAQRFVDFLNEQLGL